MTNQRYLQVSLVSLASSETSQSTSPKPESTLVIGFGRSLYRIVTLILSIHSCCSQYSGIHQPLDEVDGCVPVVRSLLPLFLKRRATMERVSQPPQNRQHPVEETVHQAPSDSSNSPAEPSSQNPLNHQATAEAAGPAPPSNPGLLHHCFKGITKTVKWFVYSLPQLEWIKLLAVPVTIAAAGNIITGNIQREANQNSALKDYFAELEKLVFEQSLLPTAEGEEPERSTVIIARGKTIAALRELDADRRKQLIAFLQASGLSKISYKSDRLKFDNRPILSFIDQDLSGIDLRDTGLSYIDFEDANLRNADLRNAYLYRSTLRKADFQGANLGKASLEGANLYRASLRDANLHQAELSQAYLREADLAGANLKGANLSRAYLLATDLRNAQLTPGQMTGEYGPYLCNSALPSNLDEVDPDRDCDRMPELLVQRNERRNLDLSLEDAQERVDNSRNKQWD